MKTAKRSALALALASAASNADESTKLDSNVQKFSYAIGLQLGDNLKNQGILSLDEKALALGIRDYLDGNDLKLDPEDIQQAVAAYQQEMMEERLALAEENRDAAESFLEKNGQRDGVVVLESGVQYEVLEKGSGENPTETDIVVVHYRGYLLDGSEFDSSFSRGQPTELEIAQVIPGWQQTLQLMKVGSKWKVWIPSDLAYGLRGAGNKIGPNEMLHFNIELLSIKEEG
jgi:FKBP-type peptidyl-prolyl cis-trans isomerase FklB